MSEITQTDSYIQTVPDKCDRIVWRNIYYHLPIQQAPEVEPVAYMRVVTERWGVEYNKIDEWSDGNPGGIPLYTHPANDGLRKAAEHLLECLELGFARSNAEEALRAELNKGRMARP